MKKSILISLLSLSLYTLSWAAPPIPFSGKLAVAGKNFHGNALFAFSIVDGEGTTHWQHSKQTDTTIENFVLNGRYIVLLGGQGMQPLPANLFLENDNLFLRVHVDLQDGQGMRLLEPDQPITSTPYALAAELALLAEKASVADGVTPGAITAGMIDAGLLADLNRTITKSMLAQDIKDDLNRTILRHHLSGELRAELNRTIRLRDLAPEVIADLNDSIIPGSITLDMLASGVRADLNRTITKSMLAQDIKDDLNRTILRHHLSGELRAELNRTIRLRDLAPEVIADLNDSIIPGSITLDMLASGVRADLNRTITKSMLAQDIKDDLNRTILRHHLSGELRAELNRTIRLRDLAPEVIADLNDSIIPGSITLDMLASGVRADLNRKITLGDLAPEVIADLNDSIQQGSITTHQLSEQILKYLKPEITLAPQAPGLVFNGQTITLHSRAEGKYLTYQWYKNGQALAGANNKRYVIEDVNGTMHDGNYTLVVSNDFGSITTQPTSLVVDGTPTSHTVASISMDMIFCPPGTFTMGSPTSETGRGTDETQHQVTLSHGFYLGKYEVTQAQYQTVMNGNSAGLSADPSHVKGSNRPVEKASWDDAQIFLSQLNTIEQTAGRLPAGWAYVLPTESQWEYASRAGTTTAYSWGNDINSSRANYNWDGGADDGNDFKQTRDVGQYAANPWGFFDMHGNVWEWTADWYQAAYPTGNPVVDPIGPASGSKRVLRGGSWNYVGTALRSAQRNGNRPPSTRTSGFGFRVGFQAVQPDTANPELELFGGASVSREAGQAWAEPGAAGHDVRDGNLTASITVSGTVDMNTTGTYILSYSVSDAAGNEANASRTVTVVGNRSVDLNATVAMDMLWVPAGTFTMGSPTDEAGRLADREDEHNVSLTKGFYLGKYEVTQAQYEAVMTGNDNSLSAKPSEWPNNPNRPVEKVSWEDVQVFITRLNAQQSANIPAGWAYVLPTESQWEYASRAGTTTAYSWGNDINSSRANYNWDGGATDGNDFKQTRDVGQYAANPWGFFDMHGNVWEWTTDWYQAAYPSGNPVIDPTGPAAGSRRVLRGGSWYRSGSFLRSAYRLYRYPSDRYNSFGFRVGFQAVQPDTASPELVLFGGASVSREAGQAWAEPGAAGEDVRDGNLTASITISGTVDMNTTGTYILTYSVADAAGNEANASRTVTVVDTTNPVLTLLGDANISQAKDSAWVDPGATASDSLDGNLTSSINVTGTVDVNTTGVYTLTYSVSDGASNETNATRTVNVGMASTYTADLNATVAMDMLWVPAGTFTMGSPTDEAGRAADREDEHNVSLTKGFYLGKYEVTQAQYEAVMTGNANSLSAKPSEWPNNPNRPVEKVSWEDVQVFITRLNAQQSANIPAGWAYVLPTESQWEYASRAGTTTAYSWGNDINSSRANYNWDGGANDGNDFKQTRDVGQYAANPWGFFDMHGNVWEWTADWYQAAYPSGNPVIDPTGPATGSRRVFRGGSWHAPGPSLRSACRYSYVPGSRSSNIGFRVGFQPVQPDTANPELELLGGASITREAGQAWAEPGAAGEDVRDGNLTASITISGTVDMNTTGTYILTYSVSDAAGNEANASRTVTVVDTTNPVLTLLGDANISQAKDSAWVDPGATASDSLDGNLTSSINVTGTVDVNTTGVYTLTYSVSDGASNETNATRTVNVGMASTYTADLNATVAMDMLWVPAGTFTMGSPTDEAGRLADREDEHNVSLTKGFYLGKYEVTQAQYEAVMTGNANSLSAKPSEWPNNPNRPVEKVSWEDVQVFITRLNAQQSANIPAGWAYVLPTESQWEYASRAGTTTAYSWGNDINSSRANYNWDGGATDGNDFKQTRDVGQYAANPWGFFDMHGNVWEWTADRYQAAYPSGNPVIDPTGPATGSLRVLRGGSWRNTGTPLRSAHRHPNNPSDRYLSIGFRVGFQKQ